MDRLLHVIEALANGAHLGVPAEHVDLAHNLLRQHERHDMDEQQFRSHALAVLRDHLFADLEDPDRDPELGDPT